MENKHLSNILCSKKNGILEIVLNRPKKRNAITISMYNNLLQILHESIQDNTIHIVVLTGMGSFFSSGNDFSFLLTSQDEHVLDVKSMINVFKEFIDALITYPKLLVAIVNGPAIGIAVTMLPLFDMIYASNTAYFQTPFTNLGLVAEGCSTYTFPRIFGKSKASEMLYLGYKMSAIEAKQYGLISESILAIKRLVKKWNQNILLQVNVEESAELIKCMQASDTIKRLINVMLHKSKI
ncbi:Enoyl-CoA delta isomerase 2, mitochondrial [Eufriesea mexicana]|nr:Enoyl-CoA delta isomerase 2, mitochondrial [Eufriesea mexicana]